MPNARPEEVIDEVFDLFIDLGADDEQLEFPSRLCFCIEWNIRIKPDDQA